VERNANTEPHLFSLREKNEGEHRNKGMIRNLNLQRDRIQRLIKVRIA